MGDADPAVETGRIVFVQRHLPPLQAGEYAITVEQALANTNPRDPAGKDRIDERYSNTKRFAIRGERFALDPPEVAALFPPDNNQGKYDNVLPHVVFARRTLPWERSPGGTTDGVPWLAVLLFDEGDPPPPLQTIQVGDLQRDDFSRDPKAGGMSKSTLPANAVSYPDGYRRAGLTFALEYGESLADRCQVIDVPVALLGAIAPSLADLPWLAHVRTVSPERKAGDPPAAPIDRAVLIGNRLPAPDTKCTAHLVSLDGLAAYLPTGDDYAPAPIALPDGTPADLIRLVSLKSWSFTSIDPKESFAGFLEHLDAGVLRVPDSVHGDADADKVVANAFAQGYTAINHQTREAERTVSWYRGPFLPCAAPPAIVVPLPDPDAAQPAEPVATADELVRQDPHSGLLDVSYAAAWQIGRLLALQNKHFAVALYNWKRANAQKTALTLEREIVEETLGTALGLSDGALAEGGHAALDRAAARLIATDVGPHLAPGARSGRPGAGEGEAP